MPTNITLAQASWVWTGRVPSVNAKTMIALAQGAWAWAGQAPAINAKTMTTLAQAAWRWTGRPATGWYNTTHRVTQNAFAKLWIGLGL